MFGVRGLELRVRAKGSGYRVYGLGLGLGAYTFLPASSLTCKILRSFLNNRNMLDRPDSLEDKCKN